MDLTIAVAQLARALGSTEIAEALEEELRSTVEEVEREEASGTDPGLRKVVEVLRDIDGCEGGEALREVVERHKSDLDPPLAARVVDAAFHVGTPSLEKVQQFAELIAEVLADRSGLVAFRLGLGRTMRANGNPELALACYTGAAEEASEIGDWATAAEAHTHAGGVLRDLNRPAEAVVEHRCALEMADRVQDPQRRAFTVGKSHLRIARAYMQVGRYAEASGAFAEAWSAAQLASDARLTEDVALFASQCYEEQGELDAAQEWGERLLAHVEGQQPMQEDVRADCLNRLALISLRAGRLDEAEERLRRAEHAARASGDEPTQANVSGNLGIIASQRDQHERALALQAESRTAAADSPQATAWASSPRPAEHRVRPSRAVATVLGWPAMRPQASRSAHPFRRRSASSLAEACMTHAVRGTHNSGNRALNARPDSSSSKVRSIASSSVSPLS
jgi:tetratricopeptide (TPR) repeat protein